MIKIEIQNIEYEKPEILKALAVMFNSIAESYVPEPKDKDCAIEPICVHPPYPSLTPSHPQDDPVKVYMAPHVYTAPKDIEKLADDVVDTYNDQGVDAGNTALNEALNSIDCELDNEGLPWDHRIHARTKSQTQGTWRLMRGVDPNLVIAVKAELKKVMSIPKPAAVFKPKPIEVAKTTISAPPEFNPFSAVSELAPNTTPFDPQPDFPEFMSRITAAATENRITPQQVIEIVKSFGLPAIHSVATRPDLIPQIMVKLDEILK